MATTTLSHGDQEGNTDEEAIFIYLLKFGAYTNFKK